MLKGALEHALSTELPRQLPGLSGGGGGGERFLNLLRNYCNDLAEEAELIHLCVLFEKEEEERSLKEGRGASRSQSRSPSRSPKSLEKGEGSEAKMSITPPPIPIEGVQSKEERMEALRRAMNGASEGRSPQRDPETRGLAGNGEEEDSSSMAEAAASLGLDFKAMDFLNFDELKAREESTSGVRDVSMEREEMREEKKTGERRTKREAGLKSSVMEEAMRKEKAKSARLKEVQDKKREDVKEWRKKLVEDEEEEKRKEVERVRAQKRKENKKKEEREEKQRREHAERLRLEKEASAKLTPPASVSDAKRATTELSVVSQNESMDAGRIQELQAALASLREQAIKMPKKSSQRKEAHSQIQELEALLSSWP